MVVHAADEKLIAVGIGERPDGGLSRIATFMSGTERVAQFMRQRQVRGLNSDIGDGRPALIGQVGA